MVDLMPDFPWPNAAQAAISLTFDDARTSQLDTGIPLLNKYGLHGTFFLSPDIAESRLADWQAAALNGHEMGNHTLTHPCSDCYDFSHDRGNGLEFYDLERIAADIDAANEWIRERFGAAPRTFAYPCGQTYVGRGREHQSYVPLVAERFLAGRVFCHSIPNPPNRVDLAQVWSEDADRRRPGDVLPLLEDCLARGHWLVLTAHDVAPEHTQGIPPETLESICRWAREKGDAVWVDTMAAVAAHLKTQSEQPHA